MCCIYISDGRKSKSGFANTVFNTDFCQIVFGFGLYLRFQNQIVVFGFGFYLRTIHVFGFGFGFAGRGFVPISDLYDILNRPKCTHLTSSHFPI